MEGMGVSHKRLKSQRMQEPIFVVDRTEHHFLNGSGEEIRISFHEIKREGRQEREEEVLVENEVRNGRAKKGHSFQTRRQSQFKFLQLGWGLNLCLKRYRSRQIPSLSLSRPSES